VRDTRAKTASDKIYLATRVQAYLEMRVSQFHLLGRRQTLSESVSRGALDLFQRELARGCLRPRAPPTV
jgi:hypothetical protein